MQYFRSGDGPCSTAFSPTCLSEPPPNEFLGLGIHKPYATLWGTGLEES